MSGSWFAPMRKFVDLHLCPPFFDPDRVGRMVTKSYELGYRLVGVTLPINADQDKIHELRKICHNAGVDHAIRVDLTPKTSHELLRDLRRFRRKFEVVSVVCVSKQVARQAAKDRRVDILSFPANGVHRRFFDDAEAKLASGALASLEIDMTPLILLRGVARVCLLSRLRREVTIAKGSNVPLIISSGASHELLLRKPQAYAALASLFDMPSPHALHALYENPLNIVDRNREKLSPNYIAPGIRVVGRKNSCHRE